MNYEKSCGTCKNVGNHCKDCFPDSVGIPGWYSPIRSCITCSEGDKDGKCHDKSRQCVELNKWTAA